MRMTMELALESSCSTVRRGSLGRNSVIWVTRLVVQASEYFSSVAMTALASAELAPADASAIMARVGSIGGGDGRTVRFPSSAYRSGNETEVRSGAGTSICLVRPAGVFWLGAIRGR